MEPRLTFRYLRPAYFAGQLDDPVLWVGVRPWGRALLFDCGQLHQLAKRALKSLAALFVTHAHMDHFMGFDTLVRQVLVSPRRFDIFGPPGLADKVEHKLSAYDWNLHENFWCSFRVHEIFHDHIARCSFPGSQRFVRKDCGVVERSDATVFENRWVVVKACQADHRIPVLVYRVDEQPAFGVDTARMRAAGFTPGPWIGELKRQFYEKTLGRILLQIPKAGSRAFLTTVRDTAALYALIGRTPKAASVGYLTDIGFSDHNLTSVVRLLRGVTLLVGECAFLADHVEKARRSYHLCTGDVNRLLQEIRPAFFLPVHLSKSCGARRLDLYRELQPAEGTVVLTLPERLLPRPLLPDEVIVRHPAKR